MTLLHTDSTFETLVVVWVSKVACLYPYDDRSSRVRPRSRDTMFACPPKPASQPASHPPTTVIGATLATQQKCQVLVLVLYASMHACMH